MRHLIYTVRTLRASLLDEPPQRVMAIAEAWDIPLEAASPGEMAEALSTAMRDSDIDGAPAALRVRDGLPADALAALNQLLAANGRLPAAAFERRFGEIRPMGPGRLERERPWRAPANAAEMLWYRGFIFRAFDRAARDPAEWFYIPAELREALSARTGPAVTPGPEPAAGAEGPGSRLPTAGEIDSALLDDITTLLIHIQTEDARVRRDGEWAREARQAASRWLRDPDGVADGRPGGRFAFLTGLVAAMGWARAQDGRLRLNPQPVASWLQLKPGRQRDALFAAWRDNPDWNDLWRVEGLSFEMTHAWSNAPTRERQSALGALEAAAGQGEWQTLLHDLRSSPPRWQAMAAARGLIAAVKRDQPEFMRPDGRYDTWHIRDARTGDFLNGFEHWNRIEGAYLMALLCGPLAWLESDRLGEPAVAAPEPTLRLGKGAEVIALPGQRFARFQLARIAQPLGPREDGAWGFALTPRALGAAARQGISEQRAIEFLQKGAGATLPAALARAIARASERGAEARTEAGVLLRAREPAILDALLRLDAGRRGLIERVGPGVALIRRPDVGAIAAAAAEMGILIDIEEV